MNTLSRYLVTIFLKTFAMVMAAATGLFLVVDFFQRIGQLSRYQTELSTIAAYFLLKLPGIVAEIYPVVALLSVLISIGLLARNREILAMHACGVSTWQLAAPLMGTAAVISFVVLLWSEAVVPGASERSHFINDVEIKNKPHQGLFNASSIWFQNKQGFVNLDYFDANRKAVYGMTLYETAPTFAIERVIEISSLLWRDGMWEIGEGTVKNIGPHGEVVSRPLEAGELVIEETPDDFTHRPRRPREFSYGQLQKQIAVLETKGLRAEELLVDLHLKLAWPFSGLVVVLLALPLAVRGGRHGGLAANVGIGMVVGFAFWVTMAVAISAGRTGGLSPVVAAWTANGIFTLLGASFYLGSKI